jgi:hypothetical protein
MSTVKGVMEVLGGFLKVSINFSMETESCLDDWTNLTLNSSLEFGEMSSKISSIDD